MPSSDTQNPALLRATFGENLRNLTRGAGSVSALCRRLGINRTQFNRYLSGESFPRPDVLHRICVYFGVDARILLEPVARLREPRPLASNHPELTEFLDRSAKPIAEDDFPSGIYRFSRLSFVDDAKFVRGLVMVYRRDGFTFLKGYELRQAMRLQGLPDTPAKREFRGYAMPQEDGVAAIVSRRGGMTCSFNYFTRVPGFRNTLWLGYTIRTVPEQTIGRRATRVVYERVGGGMAEILAAARKTGYCTADQLDPPHHRLLRPEAGFE